MQNHHHESVSTSLEFFVAQFLKSRRPLFGNLPIVLPRLITIPIQCKYQVVSTSGKVNVNHVAMIGTVESIVKVNLHPMLDCIELAY